MVQEQGREQHEDFGYRCCRWEHCEGLLGDRLGGTILTSEAERGGEAHRLIGSRPTAPLWLSSVPSLIRCPALVGWCSGQGVEPTRDTLEEGHIDSSD